MKPLTPSRLTRALVLVAFLALAACNTVEGVGKDMQAVGKSTSDAAKATGDALTGKR